MNRKTMTMAAAVLAAGVAYSYTNPLLKEVSSGEVALDVAELSGHDAIEKTGAGTLVLPDISSFSGDIVIKGGVVKTSVAGGLGDTVGKTTVEEGARLYIDSQSSDLDFSGETMEIAGSKAIYLNNTVSNTKSLGLLRLTDDARIYIGATCKLRPGATYDLAGHTLTIESSASSVQFWFYGTITAGNVIAKAVRCYLCEGANFLGGTENVFKVSNYAAVSLYWFDGSMPWTLKPDASTVESLDVRSQMQAGRNVWNGPIDLSSYGLVLAKGAGFGNTCGMTLSGKISGRNGLRTGASNVRDFTASLTNPENDFTGGIAFTNSTLSLAATGALPADGGELAMKNGTLVLTNKLAYALPSATFDGTGVVNGVVATGRWKSRLAKTGDGTFLYNTFVGAPVLDLRGGTFKMPVEKVTVITNRTPGIYGGSCAYENSTAAYTAWSGSETFTNGTVYLSPTMAYKAGTGQGWAANTLWTYRGTIWNRSPTNETWTFASCILMRGKVLLDRSAVVVNESPAGSGGNGGVKQGSVVVMPGVHTIEIRLQSESVGTSTWSGGGAYMNASLANAHGSDDGYTWGELKGIMLDRLGRGSHNVSDYKTITDSGNGDLLTLTDAADIVIRHLPVFDAVVATNGTATLDMNGGNYAVKDLVGFPTVVNSGSFSVTNDWRIASLGTATFDGVVKFTDGSTLTLDGVSMPSGVSEWTILTAAGGVEGMPAIVVANAKGEWALVKQGDSLVLKHRRNGFSIVFR